MKRFGIFQKILLTMLLVSLVPMGTIWLLDYRNSIDLSTKQVEQQLSGLSSKLALHVDDWVDMNSRMLKQNAQLEAIGTMSGTQQNPILKSITENYQWAYLAFTVGLDGNNIGRSDGKKLRYYGDRSYVKQVMDGAEIGKQVLIGKTSGKPALVLSTPIKNAQQGLSGVLAIAMTINEISQSVTNTKIGRTGFTFLLDEAGQVIAHPDPDFAKERKDLSRHPAFKAAKQGQSSISFVEDQEREAIAFMASTKQGWVLVAQQDKAEAFASIAETNRNAIILLVVTLLLVGIIAFVVAQRLANPIRKLTIAAEELSKGQMNTKITEVSRGDEIGDLAKAVERLGMSIKYALERMKRKSAPAKS
jgi:methyl-accepting chemotaxis protein